MQKKSKKIYFLTLMLALAFVVVACRPQAQPPVVDTSTPEEISVPSVSANDQEIADGTVTVAQVVSTGTGWIVIHADNGEGKPGAVIGQTAVSDGENNDVVVAIDAKQATGKLFAMLHDDAGQVNTYEFPGDDAPTTVDGDVVVKAFNVTGLMMDDGEAMMEDKDGEAMDDDGTSMQVPAPGTDPDSVDEMIVDDGEAMEDDGDAMEDDGDAMESQTQTFNVSGVNFGFDDTEIRVNKGDTVIINFTSNSGLHNWTIGEFSAATTNLNSGESSSVTFVADQAGTFEYYCSVGSHRSFGMVGKLIVE